MSTEILQRNCTFEKGKQMQIYDKIADLCSKAGITGGKLCADLGISRSLLTDLKMGRKKDLYATTAWKIADYFGVSVGHLLGIE